MKGRSFVL